MNRTQVCQSKGSGRIRRLNELHIVMISKPTSETGDVPRGSDSTSNSKPHLKKIGGLLNNEAGIATINDILGCFSYFKN